MMGMFDYVVVDTPLPGKYLGAAYSLDSPSPFQTKDLENTLSTYVITAEGELHYRAGSAWYDDVPGEFVRVPDYHGDLRFYDGVREFVARFTDGKLTRITEVERT